MLHMFLKWLTSQFYKWIILLSSRRAVAKVFTAPRVQWLATHVPLAQRVSLWRQLHPPSVWREPMPQPAPSPAALVRLVTTVQWMDCPLPRLALMASTRPPLVRTNISDDPLFLGIYLRIKNRDKFGKTLLSKMNFSENWNNRSILLLVNILFVNRLVNFEIHEYFFRYFRTNIVYKQVSGGLRVSQS